jgi:L-threonylcarbamoyladenylate synthase
VKPLLPTDENLQAAAEALRNGEMVVVPTETVYGLAVDATNIAAVRRVFVAKGRPAENPLIVHIAERSDLGRLASRIPDFAVRLMDRFWPGPLSIVLIKKPIVPDEVTAGLDTVAVRIPASDVMRRLIRIAGTPLAAPSANQFMALSPTRAEHVSESIAAHTAMVIDGGPCSVGIESTVVDCTGQKPVLLRLGRISAQEIEAVAGPLGVRDESIRRSPGMYLRHYAPRTPLELVDRLAESQAGLKFGKPMGAHQIQMPSDPDVYAAALYSSLFELDAHGLERIFVELPPEAREWAAVRDRLNKAAG